MKDQKFQSVQTLHEALDGPIAAPEHHKIIFENERVRVLDFRVKPGDIVPVHTHRWPTVNYVLNHSEFLSYDADGNLKHDSREGQADIKEGSAFFLPAFPPLHSVENIGDSELRGVTVELKDTIAR
jgi:quercetin dioxygenase-like cupin family protein